MSARGKARKRALDILYAAELREVSALDVLVERPIAEGAAQSAPPAPAYTTVLVQGVHAHRARIDELLGAYSAGWAVDRMPAVDRNVLRLAVFELLWQADEVPAPVVIDEAVRLVSGLSTDESPAFVNGVLGQILEQRARLAV